MGFLRPFFFIILKSRTGKGAALFKFSWLLVWLLTDYIFFVPSHLAGCLCDRLCHMPRHPSGQWADHRWRQNYLLKHFRCSCRNCCRNSASHRMSVQINLHPRIVLFCLLGYKDKVLYITFKAVQMHQGFIFCQTIAEAMSTVLRKIYAKTFFCKIIGDLLIFFRVFNKSMWQHHNRMWVLRNIMHTVDLLPCMSFQIEFRSDRYKIRLYDGLHFFFVVTFL